MSQERRIWVPINCRLALTWGRASMLLGLCPTWCLAAGIHMFSGMMSEIQGGDWKRMNVWVLFLSGAVWGLDLLY